MRAPKLNTTILRSKVARRIFILFISCAVFPVAVLAFMSFRHVTTNLQEQSEGRLQQATKTAALSIYERLLFLEAQLKTVASILTSGADRPISLMPRGFAEELSPVFKGVGMIDPDRRYRPIFGHIHNPPKFTGPEWQHLRAGKTLVSAQPASSFGARIFMSMRLDPREATNGTLIGEINPPYLWGVGPENNLPPMTELCVLDQERNVLICTHSAPATFSKQAKISRAASGRFEWRDGWNEYLASYWSIPLKFRFFAPQWTVVLSESKENVLAPIANFKQTFPLVILISLCMVLLVSISQIRRSLVPLEKLQEGTRRIAMREFESRVTVASGDEFEELAASFNSMASQLAKQFQTLATMAEIDRAILSALDTEKILDTVVKRIGEVFPCDRVTVALLDRELPGSARIYMRNGGPARELVTERVLIDIKEVQKAFDSPDKSLTIEENVPQALRPLFRGDVRSWLALPIFFSQRLSGVIALGYLAQPDHSSEDLLHARQIADQLAVAIHNSQLYEETKRQALQLLGANKVKDEFLSVMSHELRTPLTAVIGYSDMVREKFLGEINPEQDKALLMVKTRSLDLLNMINSILHATWMEAGGLGLQRQELNLKNFLADFQSVYRPPLEKQVVLTWDYPDDLPAVKTDGVKLRQILQNPVDNAIKFTDRGSVKISARPLPESGLIEFKVTDTGIGIPEEALPKLFDKFYQVDSSETRRHGGMGLGLYLAKKFADLLGAKIEVESEPHKGSTFTLTLPWDY